MQVVNACSGVDASYKTKTSVLDQLKMTLGCQTVLWEHNRSGVVEERLDNGLECRRQSFLVMSKGRVSQSAGDADARVSLPCHCLGVVGKGKGRI